MIHIPYQMSVSHGTELTMRLTQSTIPGRALVSLEVEEVGSLEVAKFHYFVGVGGYFHRAPPCLRPSVPFF